MKNHIYMMARTNLMCNNYDALVDAFKERTRAVLAPGLQIFEPRTYMYVYENRESRPNKQTSKYNGRHVDFKSDRLLSGNESRVETQK